jgi:hypothetical protein
MTVDPFLAPDADRLHAWISAVQATYYAIEAQSRTAWRVAAQWWDELASLHSPLEGDREIYKRLAVQAWVQAAGKEKTP